MDRRGFRPPAAAAVRSGHRRVREAALWTAPCGPFVMSQLAQARSFQLAVSNIMNATLGGVAVYSCITNLERARRARAVESGPRPHDRREHLGALGCEVNTNLPYAKRHPTPPCPRVQTTRANTPQCTASSAAAGVSQRARSTRLQLEPDAVRSLLLCDAQVEAIA
eukprot:2767834-Prymnesium_polylepis.1